MTRPPPWQTTSPRQATQKAPNSDGTLTILVRAPRLVPRPGRVFTVHRDQHVQPRWRPRDGGGAVVGLAGRRLVLARRRAPTLRPFASIRRRPRHRQVLAEVDRLGGESARRVERKGA